MRIIDISQPLGPDTAVWPGDHPVERSWSMRRERGDSVDVALLTTSVHAGTHADGFQHVLSDGAPIDRMPLEAYLGRCTVVHVPPAADIGVDAVRDLDLSAVERILFRTRDRVDATEFPDDFMPLSPELAELLARSGIRLVGTDAPSIDPLDSKALPAHHALFGAGVANLENLVLTDVTPGEYTLVALPLRLAADSSPVRAVLVEGALDR